MQAAVEAADLSAGLAVAAMHSITIHTRMSSSRGKAAGKQMSRRVDSRSCQRSGGVFLDECITNRSVIYNHQSNG
jgi:hypothetical protein